MLSRQTYGDHTGSSRQETFRSAFLPSSPPPLFCLMGENPLASHLSNFVALSAEEITDDLSCKSKVLSLHSFTDNVHLSLPYSAEARMRYSADSCSVSDFFCQVISASYNKISNSGNVLHLTCADLRPGNTIL